MFSKLAFAVLASLSAPVFAASVSFPLPDGAEGADVTVVAPDGRVVQRALSGRGQVALDVSGWAVGSYQYEVRPRLVVTDARLRADSAARRDQGSTDAAPGWPGPLAASSGTFVVEAQRAARLPSAAEAGDTPVNDDADGGARAPGKRATLAKDQVVAEDLVVQGSGCFGFDCVNEEPFGFDTVRLKENNLRIHFDDTSASAGYAANDWRLIANDNASGGANYFALEDITAARVPFRVEAGAAANQLYLSANGNVGLGTNVPGLDLHIATDNTPAVRLAQSNAGGFTAQTWDIGGNEANFFVRDLTNGSLLSFRIRPGAPTSSIDIAANGNVGIGDASPEAALHVQRAASYAQPLFLAKVAGDDPSTTDVEAETVRMRLDATGNLYVGGTIAQLSSRDSKENFAKLDDGDVLARVDALPIFSWNYIGQNDADRHFGPTAEDFHAAFGLGESNKRLAPGDVAGVALAAAQALKREVDVRDARIAELEARLEKLESMLTAPVARD